MATRAMLVAGGSAQQLHSIKTGEVLIQNVEGHAARTDSPTFKQARAALHALLPRLFGGVNPWDTDHRSVDTAIQAHHGGSIIFLDGDAWRVVLNWAGIEWAEQFAADPARVDELRQNAETVIGAFPGTEQGYLDVGLPQAHVDLLHTPITTPDDIAHYVDSIYNACVPIPQAQHTGSVSPTTPRGSGVHNYPVPACDIPMFCRADFTPFVVDPASGATAVVAPVAPRHSGDGRVRVISADRGSALAAEHLAAHRAGAALVLDATHPLALQAFKHQTTA